MESNDSLLIQIRPETPAAVLDEKKSEYSQPYTISQIRDGTAPDAWLLSGGTIIRDHRERIAVGQRDGNGADPFAFTNIGAGRCDQRLLNHCLEELCSELVLCVREKGIWHQVDLGPTTPDLVNLRKKIPTIANWKSFVKTPNFGLGVLTDPPFPCPMLGEKGAINITIDYCSRQPETLEGYVWLDSTNRTVEFRLPVLIDLSKYKEEDVEIFFAEGTGYACWKSYQQLKKLVELEQFWLELLTTPFIGKAMISL